MRRRAWIAGVAALASAVALVGVSGAAAPTPDPTCPKAFCLDTTAPVPPGVKVASNKVRVLLPDGYATSGRRYPVVLMLNGALGDSAQWTTKTDLAAYSRAFPAVYVMPEGGHHANAGWFTDWADGTWQWESWHIRSVLPWVDRTFRTNGRRAVVGASMGANGALTYAARFPGQFAAAASLSGWVDTQALTPVSGNNANTLGPADLDRVWGDQLLDADVWAQYNPTALAPRLRGTHVFVACGSGEVEPHVILTGEQGPHGGQREANLALVQQNFVAAMDLAGVEHTDKFYRGGQHSWPFFQDDLRWLFPQMMLVLAEAPAAPPLPRRA